MPSGFEEAYEELFGQKITYDPIDTTPAPRTSAISAGLSMSKPGGLANDSPFQQAYNDLMNAPAAEAQPEGEVEWSDYAKKFGAGATRLAGSVVGIPEYLARQGAGDGSSEYNKFFSGIVENVAPARRAINRFAGSIEQGMTPEAQARAAREWTNLDPNRTIWQGGADEFISSLMLKATGSAPSSLATLLPGAMMLRAGMRNGAITYLGASEGALSVGSIANNIAEEIENASEEELMQAPRYQQLVQQMGPEQAREALINEAQGYAPAIGGFVVGLISARTGRYLEPKLTGVPDGLLGRFGRGFASESAQESSQSVAEQVAQNVAAQTFDQNRSAWEGALEAGVEGGVVGGLTGGVINAAAGPRAQALPPRQLPPEDSQLPSDDPTQPPPASFQDVFGTGGQAPSDLADRGEGFSDVFQDPNRAEANMSTLEQLEARERYVRNPQASLERRSALPTAIVSGHVNPDVMAALNARRDGMIEDMFPQEPGDGLTPEIQASLGGMPFQQNQLGLREQGPPQMQQQRPLGLIDEARGTVIQPTPAQPLVEDMSPPAGFEGAPAGEAPGVPGRTRADFLRQRATLMQQAGPTFRDTEQQDLFNAPPEATPDEPSAEPLSDIVAQLEDLRDPDSPRKGVYLSAANLANLRANGALEQVRGTGVPLANFDGKGGVLVAKNRATAEELINLVGQGAASMQELLGYATGAGAGKPEGGNVAVQLRDEKGGVIRESLVADEAEADDLAAQWEEETGQEAVILSAPQVIRRREQLMRAENRQLEHGQAQRRTSLDTRVAIGRDLEGKSAERAERAIRGAASPEEAARGIAMLAKRERGREQARRWSDIDDPRSLDFENADQAQQYGELFMELAGTQVSINTAKDDAEREAANNRKEELMDQLRALRDIAKPKTQSEKIASTAVKVSPEEARKVSRENIDPQERGGKQAGDAPRVAKTEYQKPIDTAYPDVIDMTDEQIDTLDAPALNTAFLAAARYLIGRDNAESTLQQEIERHPTPSEKRKLVKRVQAGMRIRRHGPASKKAKRAKLTRTAEAKQGSDRPVRKSAFDPRVLTVELPTGEISKEKKKELASRAKQAFRALDQSLSTADSLITKTTRGDFSVLDGEREANGERSEDSRNLLLGRAYLRVLAEYGNALQKANNRSTPAAISQVEKFNELIAEIKGYTPKEFANRMSKLFYAEERESVRGAAKADPVVLGDLVFPNKRAKMTAASTEALSKRLRKAAAVERRLANKGSAYNKYVQPLMQKLIDSVARRGFMSYAPSATEMQRVQFAMRLWRSQADTREAFFVPIRQFFTELGINVMDTKFDKNWKWETPDKLLYRRSRFGRREANVDDAVPFEPVREMPKEQQVEEFARGIKLEREAIDRDAPYTPAQVERLTRMKTYHEAVLSLRNKLSKSSSVLDIQRAEEEFIHTLRDQGLWEWTRQPIGLAKFTLPGFARDATSTVRTIGSRLRVRDMTREQALEAMQDRYPLLTNISQAGREETRSEDRAERAVHKDLTPRREFEAELRELLRREDMTPEQRRLLEALERQDKQNLNLVVDDLYADDAQVEQSAKIIGELLENQADTVNAQTVLERAAFGLPPNNRFRVVLDRLAQVPGMRDVMVMYDRTGNMAGKNLAQYRVLKKPNADFYVRSIIVNRKQLEAERARGRDPHVLILHALMHEATHAATNGAMRNNPATMTAVRAIMQQTRRLMRARGIDTDGIYAFRDNDPEEFIAEAFSNGQFQQQLRNTYIEPKLSIWQWIMGLVKKVMGLNDNPAHDNVLDAVMSLTDTLFTGEERIPNKGGRSVQNMRVDDTVRGAVANVLDKYSQTSGTWKSLWQRAKDKATSGLLPAMSMEQMRDTYSRYFQSGSNNPMADYMRSFFKRNADNSANMETADKLSRKWTELAEQDREGALEMSRIMTEATMHQMHPQHSITDPENEHLKHDSQKAKHAELQQRWNSLSGPMQDLYEDVEEFYDETMRREVSLMTLNALRGYLTHGKEAPLTEDEFDYTESDVEGMRLDTMQGLEDEFGGLVDKTGLKNIHRISSIPQQRKGPYFPLMRHGDFVVYAERQKEKKAFGSDHKAARQYRDTVLANDPTLDATLRQADSGDWVVTVTEKEFRAAESRSEAEADRAEMSAKYGEANTTPVQLKADLFSGEAAIKSNAGLRTILGKLDGNPAAQAAVKNFYLQSLADKSFRKHELSRKNRRGVDYETQHRTFASYAKQAAYYTSQLRFGWQMADAMKGMQETAKDHRDESEISGVRMGEVVREINTRDKLTHDLQEVNKWMRRGVELSHFMLLTSPSYWMINATQPYMVTLPWLAARSSVGDAVSALTNAQGMIISPLVKQAVSSFAGLKALTSKVAAEKAFSVLEQVEDQIRERGGERAPEYLKMLTALKRESIIDLSFIAELRDVASGKQSVAQNVLDASRIMAHLTEVNNRIMTALAAYDISRSKGASPDSAIEFAKQATSLTQFNYSSGNKPRLFQAQGPLGNFGPLVFQFMQYPQHMYALLISNMRAAMGDSPEGRKIARKTLAGIFATHLAAGGVIGMTLQPIKWAMGLAAFMFGDDDEPFDFDRSVREATNELFGDQLGEVVSSGLPRLGGVDLSQRMSLGTLYMVDLKTDNANSFMGSALQSFGGPLTGLGSSVFTGVQNALNGEYQKAFESIEPKVLKDLSKWWRFSREGMTDATGKTFLPSSDLSPQQLFLQAIGLNPEDVGDAYVRRNAVRDAKEHDRGRKDRLLQKFRRAESPEERREVAIEIAAFNKHNPEMLITRSALIRSVVGARESEMRMQKFGADLRGREMLYEERDDFMEDDDEE